MTQARAIVFDAPTTLSVQTLEPKPFEAADRQVEVSASGIRTGTGRLLRGGTVPPFDNGRGICRTYPLHRSNLTAQAE